MSAGTMDFSKFGEPDAKEAGYHGEINWTDLGIAEAPKLSPDEVVLALLKTNFEGAVAAYSGENTSLELNEAEMAALTSYIETMAMTAKRTVDAGVELKPGSKSKLAYEAYMKKQQ